MIRVVRDDNLPHADGARAYRIESDGRVVGAVAGLEGYWVAARIGPLRSRPYIDQTGARSRSAAVAALVARVVR